jgi:acyl-coenzyme A synthetase/AMP-(fatty) acid ligase
MRNVFNVKKGDVFWAASDIGWVVGHSFMVYGPLIQGNETIIRFGIPFLNNFSFDYDMYIFIQFVVALRMHDCGLRG